MTEHRGSARKRGYDTRWDTARATFTSRNPWCLGCKAIGNLVATELVDHVEPHKGDQVKFWNTTMWQPACRWCHDVIKRTLEQMFTRGEIAISELWLNSKTAISILRRRPRPSSFGADGWAQTPGGRV